MNVCVTNLRSNGRNIVSSAQGFTIDPASFQFPVIASIDRKLINTLFPTTFTTVKAEKCHNLSATTIILSTIPFTALPPIMKPKYWRGYHHWSPEYGIETSEPNGSTA